MVYKFDHIALTCEKKSVNSIIGSYADHQISFSESSVANMLVKRPIMSVWQDDHDIIMLEKDNCMPVEITAYDTVTSHGPGKYILEDDGTITANTADIEQSATYYRSLGFKEISENVFSIKPLMGFSPVTVKLRYDGNCPGYRLDSAGFCCLAFVAKSGKVEKERLESLGVHTTDIETIILHGREMRIFFTYSDQGDACEFIEIQMKGKK